jgi:hypothetical protein
MSNTGTIFGGDILVYRNTGTEEVPVWEAFAHATSHSYSGSTNMREIADKDDGGDTDVKPGRHGVPTISISGLSSYDGADFWTLEALRQARTKIQYKFSGRPSTDTEFVDAVAATGDKYMTGYAYISECGKEDPLDGEETYSATLTCKGQPTISTVE